MRSLLLKAWSIFSPKERVFLLRLLVLMIVGALLELVGLGLVMPVLALLTEPALMTQNGFLKTVHSLAGQMSDSHFLLLLCAVVAGVYLLKNIFLLALVRIQSRFVYRKACELGSRLFDCYLHAPYAYHLRKNSAAIVNNLNLVGGVANNILMTGMMLATELVVVTAIFGTMLVLTPVLTLALLAVSAVLGVGFFLLLKERAFRIGAAIRIASQEVVGDIMQSIECIKECKVRNCEEIFSRRQGAFQAKLRTAESEMVYVGQIPRFAIESFIICAGMGVLAIFILGSVASGSIILRLSFMMMAMVRLMPSLSRINYYLSTLKGYSSAFNEIIADIESLRPPPPPSSPPISFSHVIRAEGLCFRYEGVERDTLVGLDFEIPRNSSVAFVGQTGCGKTTLMDLLLGLLSPSSGRILVDGQDIRNNLPSWQRKIGYVPQFIHLFDSSIKSNVAFGVTEEEIDEAKIRKCLETAQLWGFVSSLPEGMRTVVGERGVRLSGGQRQRIGIARALYHDPEVLALDEATSALDNDTEKAFVDALKNLKGKLTIIMIAHRLSTVKDCDHTIRLEAPHPDCPGGTSLGQPIEGNS